MRFELLVLLGLLAGAASGAERPQHAATPADIALGARVLSLQAAGSAPVAAAWLKPAPGKPPTVVIIDAADPKAPLERARFELEGGIAIALNDSGTQALAWARNEPWQGGRELRHAVVAMDLSTPGAPRQIWRREVTARWVGLTRDASAYYFGTEARPVGVGNPVTLSVVYVDGRTPVAVAGVPLGLELSSNGRYLVSKQEPIVVRELGGSDPRRFQRQPPREQSGCLLTILDDGTLVAQDDPAPRLGVYAFGEGIPRISSLPIELSTEGRRCSLSRVGGRAGLLHLFDGRTLTEFDLRDPRSPRRTGDWMLQGYGAVVAVAGDTLFAIDGTVGQSVGVMRIAPGTPVPARAFDWRSMSQAYDVVMARYPVESRTGATLDAWQARESLEEAGFAAAVDAALGGFPAARAASMLYDYGRVLGKVYWDPGRAERVFRRVIELDPDLAAAYLSLGDSLRAGLGAQSDWTVKQARKRDADRAYREYLSRGGTVPSVVASFLRDDWETAKPAQMCSAVADLATQGRLSELVSNAGSALPMGRRKVDLSFSTQGTAHVPALQAIDSLTGASIDDEIPLPVDPRSLWGGDNLGLLVYAGRYHTLYFKDLTHPRASIALDGGSACRFRNRTTEVLGQETENAGLCLRILRGERPEGLAFDGPAWMTRDEVTRQFSESGIAGVRTLDALNDGNPVTVAKIGLESSAGAGCGQTFFDLVDRDATRFESGPARHLLWELQAADPTARYPNRCGNDPRFFVFDRRIHFENRPVTWPPTDASDQYHIVREVKDGKVFDTCQFNFVTETSGRSVDPREVRDGGAGEAVAGQQH